jgi:hypothetical protein
LELEYLKSIVDYNCESGEFTWNNKSGRKSKRKEGEKPGHYDKDGYLIIVINGKKYKAHRLVWFYHNNEWPEQINHRNGIRDDNRLINLEASNYRENAQNRVEHRCGGLVGVNYREGKGYESYINVDLKNYYLGTYDSGNEAHTIHVTATQQALNKTFHEWIREHKKQRKLIRRTRSVSRTESRITQRRNIFTLRLTYKGIRYTVMSSSNKIEVEEYKKVIDKLFQDAEFDPSLHCIYKRKKI